MPSLSRRSRGQQGEARNSLRVMRLSTRRSLSPRIDPGGSRLLPYARSRSVSARASRRKFLARRSQCVMISGWYLVRAQANTPSAPARTSGRVQIAVWALQSLAAVGGITYYGWQLLPRLLS
jgi:hypothetical protein